MGKRKAAALREGSSYAETEVRPVVREVKPQEESWMINLLQHCPAVGIRMEVEFWQMRAGAKRGLRFYRVDEQSVLMDETGAAARLCGTPRAGQELAAFLEFMDKKQLLSTGWAPEAWAKETISVMQWQQGAEAAADMTAAETIETAPPMTEVMDVVDSCSPMGTQHRENLYADLCVRRLRGWGDMYGTRKNGLLVSVAGSFALTGTRAYIAGVNTRPGYRGQGYATALVRRLCRDYGGRQIVLWCEPGMRAFYRQMGFVEISPGVVQSMPVPADGRL